ncbi:DUF11 domain-containing protein [Pedobacter polaris]|uniref:DUF11 domain-containing protein n=1 Tax=Pedobacter polaris TaxID=2571273 RepID=UPI00145CB7E6|nr:DUF11 domain-containing protein [Pedobacter polaris]
MKLSLLTSRLSLCGLAIILLSLFTQTTFAEGSKDLYPAGALGNRAFLLCNTNSVSLFSNPFKTTGTHYVYANAGEIIAVASSAQGKGLGTIILTAPNGMVYTSGSSTTVGLIPDRNRELAGPSGVGPPGGKYTPFTKTVLLEEAGIWKIDFITPLGPNGNATSLAPADVLADDPWTQGSGNTNADNGDILAAWDVSVRAGTTWLTGRVFTNVLTLYINGGFTQNTSFHVTNYILTQDGRAYRVKTNGNNGIGFTFFSNNNGFAVNGVPTYKSLNFSDARINPYVHDPRSLDDDKNITHKIFYNKPNPDLPQSAPTYITAAGQSTWLKNIAVLPVISNLLVTGVEGTIGRVSQKGANISFNSTTTGTFTITIPVASGTNRVMTGVANVGANSIFWDAKDGNGNFVPAGSVISQLKTMLRSAEVHFPYIDMEINPNGITIELTDNTTNYDLQTGNPDRSVYSDLVYWDDSDISNRGNTASETSDPYQNLTGISSNSNGHIWGKYSGLGGSSFGNEKSMDTWAYIQGSEEAQPINMVITEADLKIESITPDLSKYFSDKTITYTISVKNDGPSAANGAKLAIALPAGLTISSVTPANPSTGVSLSNGVTSAQSYTASLDLPNQAIIDFVIVATFTGSYNQTFDIKASILRPADLSDIDATGNNAAGPVDPDEECKNGISSSVGLCNNIKYNTVNGQEVCQGSTIVSVSYPLSADGTQFENPTLPTALSSQDAAGNRTISGSLSSSGIQMFYIKTLNTKRTQTNVIIRSYPKPTKAHIQLNN